MNKQSDSRARNYYRVGDVIRRASVDPRECCGVVIGWDEWLQPLVFLLRVQEAAAIEMRIVSLADFEAGQKSDLLYGNGGFRSDVYHCEEDLTARLWQRLKPLLSGRRSVWQRLAGRTCSEIAQLITAEPVPIARADPAVLWIAAY